jgi:predicted ArsR family transcriptional regulator
MDDKMGTGDLKMQDILKMDESQALKLFRNRFIRYKKLVDDMGEEAAYEKMLEKYPDQQKALMGAFIDNNTLAEGFKKSIPLLRQIGFTTEIIDVSQNGADAALEIQRVCPFLPLTQEYGFENPCRIFCEMEQEAARRAFPEMKASLLSRQAEGDAVCVFKYERPAQTAIESVNNTTSFVIQFIDLVKLAPTLIQAGIRLLKMRLSKSN